jgi:putative pyrroloquinoline-quinone binding quinoprotein
MADSIYWIGSAWSDLTIRRAPLSGGGTVDTLYSGAAQGLSMPHGLAIDSAAGQIYWTNRDDNTIRRAPLAGGGTVETLYTGPMQTGSEPAGIAIHPAGGRIYWASTGDSTIRRAPLTAGGNVETLYTAAQGVNGPTGVAIDPAAGRIYWANVIDRTIRRAPLAGVAGGGTVTPLHGPQDVSAPWWVAIDPDAGRIYWSHWSPLPDDGRIRGAPLAGGGTIDTLYDNARGVSYPGGMAIDPNPAEPALPRLEVDRLELGETRHLSLGETRRFSFSSWLRGLISQPSGPPARIYWGNTETRAVNPSNNTIQRAPVAGGGTVDTLYGSAQGVAGPAGLAVLRAPIAVAPPTVGWEFTLSGGGFGGQFFGGVHSNALLQRLGCSRGTWAPDLLGSFLYRAPQSFAYQWRLNGTDIGGATSAQYNPTAPGSYSCRVTATNAAGSATQMSAAFVVSSSMLPP